MSSSDCSAATDSIGLVEGIFSVEGEGEPLLDCLLRLTIDGDRLRSRFPSATGDGDRLLCVFGPSVTGAEISSSDCSTLTGLTKLVAGFCSIEGDGDRLSLCGPLRAEYC